MLSNHTDLLNFLAEKIKAFSYLEIGVSNRVNNYDKIRCKFKIGVDPAPTALATFQGTSDEFFDFNINSEFKYKLKFDLIFIDGLHEAEQVRKDFHDALECINPNGYIVLHDTYPEAEYLTHVPRDKKGRWLGDVYKFACRLGNYPDIEFCTLDFDNGCTIVWKNPGFYKGNDISEITWNRYVAERKELMNVMNVAQFVNLFGLQQPV